MSAVTMSTSGVDLAAGASMVKLAQLQQRTMSRHSTATSLSSSFLEELTVDFDHDGVCSVKGAAAWDFSNGFHDEEEFQDRVQTKYQDDSDMAFRPDLYADAFEIADGDLLLYDWEDDRLPEEYTTAVQAQKEAQPAENTMPVDASDSSTLEDASPVLVPKASLGVMLDGASENSSLENAPSRLVPKAPPSKAPRGFVRKHQDVLIVGFPAEHASETSLPKQELVKMPQGSAKAAIAALRPAA